MKKIVKMMMTFAAVVMFAAANAQDGGKLTLDLETALEIALSENPTIKAAGMEIERFDYVRREVIGNHLPQLSASGQYTYSVVKQEMSKGLSFGADNTITGMLDLSIPLFAPAVYTSLKMTATQRELAVEQARSSRIELANQVRKAFYVILLSEQSYEVLAASDANIRDVVESTRVMFDSGLASEYDLLTAEVQLSNLQPTIIQTANSVKVAKQMLKMFLGVPERVEIEVNGSLADYRDQLYAMPELTADVDDNSEIRQLDYQQTLLRQQIRLTNTARMPVVAAYGSFIYTGNDMKPIDFGSMLGGGGSTETTATASNWWWQHPVSVGLQLSVPIFSGLKNVNKVRQLRNTVGQIDLQKDYLRRAKELEARTAANNLITARETMLANEMTEARADKAYRISKTRFEAGAGTMLEVNQAELNVTQARLNHSQAIYEYLAAKADYDKATGREQ